MTAVRGGLEALALAGHHGVIARAEALEAGMTPDQVKRLVAKGEWVALGPKGWYVLAKRSDCPKSRLYGATRATGGLAWGLSALALHGLVEHRQPSMIAGGRPYRGRGFSWIHVRHLDLLGRVWVDAIPTVGPAAAVVAFGRWARSDTELHTMIDRAVRERLVTWAEVEDVLRLFPRRGRGGSVRMREVLADHFVDDAVPLSDWGRWFMVGLTKAGLERPRMEYRVETRNGRLVAQVDLAYPHKQYAIELDSHTYHLNADAFERDRQRDGDLAQLGWTVRRFTWRQWKDQRPWVIGTISADLVRLPSVPHGGTLVERGPFSVADSTKAGQ